MQYKLKVINFNDDEVILEDETKNIIYWPKTKLKEIPEIGEILNFNIGDDKPNISPEELLNELLNIKKH